MVLSDDALYEIYQQLHPKLMRYLDAELPCPADADSVAQDVWPAVFDKLKTEPVTWPSALLMTVARCRVTNWYRDHQRDREQLTGKAETIASAVLAVKTPSEPISNEELAAAIRELPERQREAVFLRFVAGLETSAIARHMGLGTRRINQLVERALLALHASPRAPHFAPAAMVNRTEARP